MTAPYTKISETIPEQFDPSAVKAKAGPPRMQRWPGLMNMSTLAEYLDMSVTTVANMVKAGQLPPPTVTLTPRLKRWSRQSIDAHFDRAATADVIGPSIDELMERSFMATRGGR